VAEPFELVFSVEPVDTVADSAILPPIQVSIKDEFGDTILTATDNITIAIDDNPGGGVLSGTLTRRAVNGVATFTGLSIDEPGEGYTLKAVLAVAEGELPEFDLDLEADAGLGLGDGDSVPVWEDQSPTENNGTQLTVGNRPTFLETAGPGGRPCVRFDGNDFLNLTNALPRDQYSLFAVVKPGGATLRSILCGLVGSLQYRIGNPNTQALIVCNTINIGVSDTALSNDEFQQINVTWDGETATFRLNGAADGEVTNAQALSADIDSVGRNPELNAEFFKDDMCVVAACLRLLTLPEVQAVESAIAARWGVAGPVTYLEVTSSPFDIIEPPEPTIVPSFPVDFETRKQVFVQQTETGVRESITKSKSYRFYTLQFPGRPQAEYAAFEAVWRVLYPDLWFAWVHTVLNASGDFYFDSALKWTPKRNNLLDYSVVLKRKAALISVDPGSNVMPFAPSYDYEGNPTREGLVSDAIDFSRQAAPLSEQKRLFNLPFRARSLAEMLEMELFWDWHYPGRQISFTDPVLGVDGNFWIDSNFKCRVFARNLVEYSFDVREV
jgi:hypothetical protein